MHLKFLFKRFILLIYLISFSTGSFLVSVCSIGMVVGVCFVVLWLFFVVVVFEAVRPMGCSAA